MTAVDTSLVSIEAIRAAAQLLDGVAVRTPLLPLEGVGSSSKARVWVKPEMLQRGGAFKFRGAYNFLARLAPSVRSRGVVAPSSGNHAQAVALAAKLFGIPATVVMPTTVTSVKKVGAERLGAKVILAGTTTKDRYEKAVEIVAAEGGTLVPPYDDLTIIAGQATTGLEIVEDLPTVHTVLVPVGGGGLSAGVSTAIKLLVPDARVIGVEPKMAPKLSKAREAGVPVAIKPSSGLADGLLAIQIGDLTFAHHQAYIDEVVTVDDSALPGAMRFLLDRAKIMAEPSGAITIAALLEGIVRPEGDTVAVLSGGNVEWEGFRAVLDGGARA